MVGLGVLVVVVFKQKLINRSITRTLLAVDYHYSFQGDTDNCSRAEDSTRFTKGSPAPPMGEAVGPQERGRRPWPRSGTRDPACRGLPPQRPPLHPQPSRSPGRPGRCTAMLPFAFTPPSPAHLPATHRGAALLPVPGLHGSGTGWEPRGGSGKGPPPAHSSHAALLFALFS